MRHYLKRFTEWATAYVRKVEQSPFERARIRITVLFSAVMMTIIVLFSLWLFISLEQISWDTISENTLVPPSVRVMQFSHTITKLERNIFLMDCTLLVLVVLLGYMIATRVLAPIQESVVAQKRFLADASHDLRTPLAIMKSELQVVLSDHEAEKSEYREAALSSLEEIDKMSVLIDDLLFVARSDAELVELKLKVVDMHEFMVKLVLKSQHAASIKGLNLYLNDPAPGMVVVNPQHLERAVQNVLQNALRYTPSSGTITVASESSGAAYVIRIRDTGVGIPEHDLPNIFERFYKAEHSRGDQSGFGLGLPIAKQVIEQIGGCIGVESKVGVGTTVEIRLPRFS